MAERRDEGFLARWSRRKQAARAAGQEPERSEPQTPAPAQGAAAPDRAGTAPRPDLPDPATLEASSDFSAFLGRDVPVETQRAALRRLWRLDPSYNRLDGLDDYCEDFTDRATVMQGLRTAYRVGRGMLERSGEPAASAAAADQTTPEATLAPAPQAQSDDADLPAPVDAGSLRPAAAAQPATEGDRRIAGVPAERSDGRARPATQPRRGRRQRRRPAAVTD